MRTRWWPRCSRSRSGPCTRPHDRGGAAAPAVFCRAEGRGYHAGSMTAAARSDRLRALLAERIVVLDGATGTYIQGRDLTARDFGGPEYEGCNEHLVLTRPDVVREMHEGYLAAGADIVETNTFGGTRIPLAEYGLAHKVRQINATAARLARAACAKFETPERPRFVAGSMGPGTKTISVTGGITFDEVAAAFAEQTVGLVEGGADILFLETQQDTLNVKAALLGIDRAFAEAGRVLPRRGLGEHHRGLLRDHGRARPRAGGARGPVPAARGGAGPTHRRLRHRGPAHRGRPPAGHRRRAYERHRQPQVQGAGHRRRPRPGRRDRTAAGARRGAGPGRLPREPRPRGAGRHDGLPRRADAHGEGAAHARLDRPPGPRAGPRALPGQGDRQLHQPRGRRGALREGRAAHPPLRRGGGRRVHRRGQGARHGGDP